MVDLGELVVQPRGHQQEIEDLAVGDVFRVLSYSVDCGKMLEIDGGTLTGHWRGKRYVTA